MAGIVWKLKQDEDGNILYIPYSESFNNGLSHVTKRQKRTKRVKEICDIKAAESKHESILKEYFNLHFSLEKFYTLWNEADDNFKQMSSNFKGIRILRQDPVENLFSFICSANNNIPRYVFYLYHF